MKWYIARCRFDGGEVIKFRVQAHDCKGLEAAAAAMIISLTGHIPVKVEVEPFPMQVMSA